MKLFLGFVLSVCCSAQGIPFNANGMVHAPSGVTFTHIQGGYGTTVVTGTTFSVTLGTNPATNNAVVCMIGLFANNLTLTSVLDGNSNSYTTSASSPSNVQGSSTSVFLVYLLNAPANADKTITVTASGTITFTSGIRCEEFHRSSGTWSVDTDIAGNGAPGSSVANTPSITPAAAGELLYSAAYLSGGVASVDSPWTQDGATYGSGKPHGGGYILNSSSGATALAMTAVVASSWNSIAIALK